MWKNIQFYTSKSELYGSELYLNKAVFLLFFTEKRLNLNLKLNLKMKRYTLK